MDRRHLDSPEGRAYLLGLAPAEGEAFEHVLSCELCRHALAGAFRDWAARRAGEQDQVFEALAQHGWGLVAELAAARELIEEVLLAPPAAWEQVVAGRVTVAFLALLVDQVAQRINPLPVTAEALAELAVGLINRHPGHVLLRTQLQVRCLSWLGYARSRRFDWAGAESAFTQAGLFLSELPETSAEASYCRLLGQSRELRGQLPEALALYGRAAELAGRFGETGEELLALELAVGVHEGRDDAERSRAAAASWLVRAQTARIVVDVELRQRFEAAQEPKASGFHGLPELVNLLLLPADSSAEGEAKLKSVLEKALDRDHAGPASWAAVNLCLRYAHQKRPEELRKLVQAVAQVISAEELPAGVQEAMKALLEALRDAAGGVDAIARTAGAIANAAATRNDSPGANILSA